MSLGVSLTSFSSSLNLSRPSIHEVQGSIRRGKCQSYRIVYPGSHGSRIRHSSFPTACFGPVRSLSCLHFPAEIRADLSELLLIILAKSSLTMEPGTSSSLSPDPSVGLLPFDASFPSPLLTFLLFGLLQPSTSPTLSTSSLELTSSHQSTESSLLKLIRLNLTESES